MPDLRVDTEAIRRSQSTLGGIGQTLESATADLDRISAASVAQEDLRARIDELGSSWGIGLKKLGGYAGDAAAALAGVAESFEQVDGELAKGLRQAADGGAG